MREPLQQLWRTSLGDAGAPVHDEVVLQARPVQTRSLDRDDDPLVALDVADLLLPPQVTGDELVILEPHPDARHLRAAVGVERDEVGQRAGLDQLASTLRQSRHERTLTGCFRPSAPGTGYDAKAGS